MRSLFFNLYFYAVNLALFIICLPLILFGRKGAILGAIIWGAAMLFGAKYIAGIDYEIIGEIPATPAIFASKHQSAWETMFFQTLPNAPALVFKKELSYIPIYGIFLLLGGHILVDRKSGVSSLKKMLTSCRERIAEGRSIIIFPEGTRSRPGDAPQIKSGITAIYNNIDAPIVPVSLNSGEFWPKGGFAKKPGKIIITFGAPMEKNLSKAEFLQQLAARITPRPE